SDNNVDDKSIIANFFIFVAVLAFIWGIIAYVTRKKIKTNLYKTYGTTDKTFQKWITYNLLLSRDNDNGNMEKEKTTNYR
ncbi:MAG: hypothetical protein AB8G11_11275, partial [Saprospiraceae bacterium]